MERWKPISGYEGLYEVSDKGNVRSVDRYIDAKIKHVKKRLIKGVVLKKNKKRNGYFTVDLCKNGVVKTTLIHRLVANAFVENDRGCKYVNHIDSNRENNNASNLEWVTSRENRMHGIDSGNVVFRQTKAVKCVENGKVFEQAKIAAKWLIDNYPNRSSGKIIVIAQNIRRACNGGTPKAYGFTWKYHKGSTTIPKGSTRKRVEMGSASKEDEDIV